MTGIGVGPGNRWAPTDSGSVADGDASISFARWGHGPAEIVLLHDGLGSIGQWRTMPGRLAAVTARTVLAYDRPGHGGSSPIPSGPWPADWLHVEADRLGRLLTVLDVDRPLLVGHSDGGSIALLHAAATVTGWRGVVTLAAHSWVEQRCVDAIAAMVADRARIVDGLAPHHAAAGAIFDAWSGVWLSEEFRRWDIRDRLWPIAGPAVVAQGRLDEYATEDHVAETVAAIGGNARGRLLDGVGHLLHHQDPELVVRVVAETLAEIGNATGGSS